MDTGVLAFDGSKLAIHLKFELDVSKNVGKYVLSAMQNTTGSKYGGFILFFRKENEFDLYASQDTTISSGWFGARVFYSTFTVKSGVQEYTVDVTYDSSTRSPTMEFNNKTFNSTNNANFPSSPFNATITIGGIGVENNHTRDVVELTVKEFSVKKIDS